MKPNPYLEHAQEKHAAYEDYDEAIALIISTFRALRALLGDGAHQSLINAALLCTDATEEAKNKRIKNSEDKFRANV